MRARSSFGLILHGLGVDRRVLVACTVAAARAPDQSFTAIDALRIFDAVWVPRPGNIHDRLNSLEGQQLVRRAVGKGRWAVTPLGHEKVREFLADLTLAEIERQLRSTPGSQFGHTYHPLVVPAFAPGKWVPSINRLLEKFPFEQNVFLMTRFPNDAHDTQYLDPVRNVLPILREALRSHGLTLHLASDRQLDDDVLGNVAAHMWACNYGLGILEDRIERGLNYNVITEIGAMLMTGRRCALMKDTTVPVLPTDLSGQIYKRVDLADAKGIEAAVHSWVAEDLGFGRCEKCPSI